MFCILTAIHILIVYKGYNIHYITSPQEIPFSRLALKDQLGSSNGREFGVRVRPRKQEKQRYTGKYRMYSRNKIIKIIWSVPISEGEQ